MKEDKVKLPLRAAAELAAPHTWPAAVTPVLLGSALAWADGFSGKPWLLLGTLAVAVLLQSAVNTLNDARDFLSGLDSEENCGDPTDAALIYSGATPKGALCWGFALLFFAALIGGVLVLFRGPALLWYAACALAAILLYVLPRLSASELPLGEALSGLAMGGVLPAAAYHIQAGVFAGRQLFLFLPAVITVGCIMLANNTSDIEKDRSGGRRTLPALTGRPAAEKLLRCALIAAALFVFTAVISIYPRGAAALPVLPAGVLLHSKARGIFLHSLSPQRRIDSMAGVLRCHTLITGVFCASLILCAL